jgi:pyocin large subunit-like protein
MMKRVLLLGAAGALALTLAACGEKSSAVAPRDQSAGGGTGTATTQATARDPRDAPIPKIDGKPMWAANRKHTAEENAQYQFTKNGGDFGAKNESDYLMKVHNFVDRPPSGVETIDRANGDKLIYDPKGNIFAVVSRDGAPRTMFKPRDGESYWAQQKDREAKRKSSASQSGSGGVSDQG